MLKKTLTATSAILMGASRSPPAAADSRRGRAHRRRQIVMGFAQVGAESGWRTANTKSIQESAEAAGVELKFSDAQQKQENQIKAIRSYIQQKVDVIAFSPVVETGWDAVLQEAKRAKIPVILTDRSVDSEDTSLYETFLGSDFVLEGEKAGEWLVENAADSDVDGDGDINVVQLEGTTGAAPAIDRAEGFADAIAADPSIEVTASQTGDFTRDGGKKVMESFLQVRGRHRRRLRPQRRHGPRRDRGDRGRRSEARHGHQDHHRRRRSRTAWRRSPRARSTSSSSATRCSAPS